MIESRFAIERMATERQAELQQVMEETMGAQMTTSNARVIALRARTVRLVGVVALALALLGGGLLNPAGEVAADGTGGGISIAEGIGYVP